MIMIMIIIVIIIIITVTVIIITIILNFIFSIISIIILILIIILIIIITLCPVLLQGLRISGSSLSKALWVFVGQSCSLAANFPEPHSMLCSAAVFFYT